MRISTTALEAYRLFRVPEQEWMSLADLKASILGEGKPDRPMLVGRALEDVLAKPSQYYEPEGDWYRCGGYRFQKSELRPLLNELKPGGLFQLKMVSPFGPHQVVSKADYVHGLLIREFKTLWSTFDAERYADSYQWRFMADAFSPALVAYNVVSLQDGDSPQEIVVKSLDEVRVYPYPRLHADCERLVHEFVGFAKEQGWEDELNRRQVVYA